MFKCFVIALAFAVPIGAFVAGAAETGKVVERVAIVPDDNSPFKVEASQTVRLTGEGISGSKITVDVHGPAKVGAKTYLRNVKGGHVLIGMVKMEYEIKPTGQGTVKVRISSTPPQPNAEPIIKDYQFEVN